MEIRLLGAVEADADGTELALGPPRQRFVLAVLALEANHVVPVERLVELSWPESPPRTAHHAIRVAVSRLRAEFRRADPAGRDIALMTNRAGYRLETDPGHVDAHLFRGLLRTARSTGDEHQRIDLLGRALGLWRGPALAGVCPTESAAQLAAGLEEARLLASEDEVEAYLRVGRHREVLDKLTGLVEEHPTRERPLGQLMIALYRSGRAQEALGIYQRVRRRLADTLGLTPGTELRRIELAILRDDGELWEGTGTGTGTGVSAETCQGSGGNTGTSSEEPASVALRIADRLSSADPAVAGTVARLLGVADDLLDGGGC